MNELKPGDFIAGEYRVRRVFGGHGKSGMGVVYLVQGRTSEEPFVLKTFQSNRADATSLARFKAEAETWVNIGKHLNIVQCQWVNVFSGQLYVAAEFVSPDSAGRNTLTQHIASGDLSLRQQLHWIAHFCFGMKHAMTHGLKAHRDVKPDNLMVDTRGRLKITDFGLAKGVFLTEQSDLPHEKQSGDNNLTAAGTAFGTPPFMSPEQFFDSSAVDHRADIYSLGVVIYLMISGGKYPIMPASSNGWAAAHHQQRVARIDHPLMRFAEKCLEKERRNRFQSYDEILEAVGDACRRHGLPVPKNETDSRAEFERQWSIAMSLVNLDKPAEAIAKLKQMETQWPDSPEVHNEFCRAHLKLGNLQEALSAAEQSLRLDEYSTADWNNLGGILATLGRLEEAQNAYGKALQIEPENTGAMIGLAQVLMLLGELQDAKTWCELAVFWRPEKDKVLQIASDCFAMCGEHVKAVELLKKLLADYPDDAIAWFKLGNAMTAMRQLPDALKCYDNAIESAPRTKAVWNDRERMSGVLTAVGSNQVLAEAWNAKGLVLKSIGQPAEAIACYDKALAIDPRKADVWCNKGSALYALGRVEEAARCLEKATSLNPGDMKSWCNRGVMLKALGHLQEAIACYDKALEINPRDVMTWGNKGNAFGALEQLGEAKKCFEKILVIDPNNAAAQSMVEQLRRAGS